MSMLRMRKFQSPTARARHRRALFLKWELRAALLGAVLLLFTQIADTSFFRVKEISVSGNEAISGESVVSLAERELHGYYLALFSRRNALLLPRGKIVDALKASFPRIETARTDLEGFTALTIHVKERDPVGVACPFQNGDASSARGCLYIDEDGLMFAEAPQFSGDLFFTYTAVFKDPRGPIGAFLVEAKDFADALSLKEAIEEAGVGLSGVVLYDSYFAFEIDGGGEIRINREQEEYTEALVNLSAVLEAGTFRSESGELSFDGLEYIDLRFGNKVFYKFGD